MKTLNARESKNLIAILKDRFENNMNRHKEVDWIHLQNKLLVQTDKLWSLNQMEKTGGAPDVIDFDKATGRYLFCDCSPESPQGRRSLCYDQEALNSRKKNKPVGSAMEVAHSMGIDLLTEDEYRFLQKIEAFDLVSSSWVVTPPEIRKLGGALFCDRRYNRVFTYHNGAESYYAARGFRGALKV